MTVSAVLKTRDLPSKTQSYSASTGPGRREQSKVVLSVSLLTPQLPSSASQSPVGFLTQVCWVTLPCSRAVTLEPPGSVSHGHRGSTDVACTGRGSARR